MEALWEAGRLEQGLDLSLGHQGKLPEVEAEGELSLEDGLKGRVKVLHVISEGVATIGNGLMKLLIAYEAADILAHEEIRQEDKGKRT